MSFEQFVKRKLDGGEWYLDDYSEFDEEMRLIVHSNLSHDRRPETAVETPPAVVGEYQSSCCKGRCRRCAISRRLCSGLDDLSRDTNQARHLDDSVD
jgi:hypothetical protein